MASSLENDPRMWRDFGAFSSLLIWWPIVQVLEGYDSEFHGDLSGQGTFRFPDGTVRIDMTDKQRRFWLRLDTYRQSGLLIRQNTIFRSLNCFPRRDFQFLTTWEYFDRIGSERDFLVIPTNVNPAIFPNESDPENLRVDIHFWRKPSKAVQQEFEAALIAWSNSVRSPDLVGACGSFQMATLTFDKKRATFRIRATGQDAINWMIISILNFGARIAPLSDIRFGLFQDDG